MARCICCGGVLGEIENGKILCVTRNHSKRLDGVDYIGICGDCIASADSDDDEFIADIVKDGGIIA